MLYSSTMILNQQNKDDIDIDLFKLKPSIDGEICLSTDGDNIDTIFDDLIALIKLLTKHDYVCKVRKEVGDDSIIIIEYSHDENQDFWGGPELLWVTPEEASLIETNRSYLVDALIGIEDED